MKNLIELFVQSNGAGGFRLGISVNDSKEIFKCRGVRVQLHLPTNIIIDCKTSCGNPCDEDGSWLKLNPRSGLPIRKKGYDLNSKILSTWISKNYPKDPKSDRVVLKFKIEHKDECFQLTFDKKKKN